MIAVPPDVQDESDIEPSITEPMNIDFTYLMKITSLPDSPLIKDEWLKIPLLESSQVKKSVDCPVQFPVAPEGQDDDTNMEPMNIDFTYLMKITSAKNGVTVPGLPDPPLIVTEQAPSKAPASPHPVTISRPESSADCSHFPLSNTLPGPDEPSNLNSISSTFDLETLIHDRCKSLLAFEELPAAEYFPPAWDIMSPNLAISPFWPLSPPPAPTNHLFPLF